MKKATKLMAVLSAAAVMTAVTPSLLNGPATVLAASSGWVDENGTLRYYDSDGDYVTEAWKKKDSDWYYLNDEGEIATDEMIDEYYVDETGKKVSNHWLSVENEDIDDPDSPAELWYYFGKDGRYIRSKWQSINDKWYYFNDEGIMLTGLQTINDAIYYLGDDGVRRTGWIQLAEDSDEPTDASSWRYFEKNGKMVENEIDKKINGNYYTFVDGIMQTGWYKVPADSAQASETGEEGQEASVTSTAPIAGYQYYEEDGKRASGWYDIQGVEGISSDEEDTYRFYFKKGVPCFAESGVQVFSINSKQYAFNTKGEMQTGLQTITLEDGSTATAYFAEDGSMKTGKQTIYNEETGENESWYFHTSGANRGQGYNGIYDNRLYINGLRQEAESDLRYAPVSFDGKQYLVNASGIVQRASSSSKSSEKPELGTGFKDVEDANGDIWVVNTEGVIQ